MRYIYCLLFVFCVFNCYSQDDNVYNNAGLDVQPSPKEGIEIFKNNIVNNIPCLKAGVFCHISFIVEKDGSLSNVKKIRCELLSNDINCENLIQTAIQNSPKWNFGVVRKNPVRVLYSISFKKVDQSKPLAEPK